MNSLQRVILFFVVIWLLPITSYAGNEKVEICHFPPGNQGNFKIISVSKSSAETHFGKHGDVLYVEGQCLTSNELKPLCTEESNRALSQLILLRDEFSSICNEICASGACEHQEGETEQAFNLVEEKKQGIEACIEQVTTGDCK